MSHSSVHTCTFYGFSGHTITLKWTYQEQHLITNWSALPPEPQPFNVTHWNIGSITKKEKYNKGETKQMNSWHHKLSKNDSSCIQLSKLYWGSIYKGQRMNNNKLAAGCLHMSGCSKTHVRRLTRSAARFLVSLTKEHL